MVLLLLGESPIFTDIWLLIKRVIVVGLPVSIGAIFVDSFDKE